MRCTGWLPWEAAPTLNPDTGRPHNFLEMKPAIHTQLWTNGVRQALAFGRYPALLVSLHAKTIYTTFFNFEKAPPEDARLVRSFLDDHDAWLKKPTGSPSLIGGNCAARMGRNR